MHTLAKKIRSLDLFGAQIRLTFKGTDSYNTAVGGCITLLLALLVLGNAGLSVYEFITHRSFSKIENKTYNEYSSNINEPWAMETKDQTMAGQISLIYSDIKYKESLPEGTTID